MTLEHSSGAQARLEGRAFVLGSLLRDKPFAEIQMASLRSVTQVFSGEEYVGRLCRQLRLKLLEYVELLLKEVNDDAVIGRVVADAYDLISLISRELGESLPEVDRQLPLGQRVEAAGDLWNRYSKSGFTPDVIAEGICDPARFPEMLRLTRGWLVGNSLDFVEGLESLDAMREALRVERGAYQRCHLMAVLLPVDSPLCEQLLDDGATEVDPGMINWDWSS